MAFSGKDVSKWGIIGIGVGLTSLVIGWLYNLIFGGNIAQGQFTLNIAPIAEGVKSQIQAGIPTDLASKIIAWLNGLIPINFMGIITLGLAGAILAVVGGYIVTQFDLFSALRKTSLRKLVGATVLGSLIIGIVLNLPKLPDFGQIFMTALTMTLYFIVVAYVYFGIARLVSKIQILKNIFIEP